MIDIQKMIVQATELGYRGDNASAKVCQDIVLKALASGPFSRNVTVKGGVVMRSKTNNIRRATQDLDIDFIKYSLTDESIDIFISKLNCLEGINITRLGKKLGWGRTERIFFATTTHVESVVLLSRV